MTDPRPIHPVPRHNFGTRLAHFSFAITIVTQLATSLIMRAPHPGRGGADSLFRIHEYSGLFALACSQIVIANIFGVSPTS
jgi:cytochrome b561